MRKNTNNPIVYTPGNPKRERKLTRDWILKAALKAVTQDDFIQAIHTLRRDDPKGFLQWYDSIAPKENVLKTTGSGVNIIISIPGMDSSKPVEGKVIDHPALETHQDDDIE